MTAQLIFKLPEDQYDFDITTSSNRLFSTIHDFKQFLRGEIKYKSDSYSDEEYKLLERIREDFNGFCIENNVNNLFD